MDQSLIDFAHKLADAAGEISAKYFRQDPGVEWKETGSPIVTEADRKAEEVMRQMIQAAFPDHGIWGEEYGPHNLDAEYVWVLDPIDGTTPFSVGKPLFANLIALCHNKSPVIGIINQPILNDRGEGVKDKSTTHNGSVVTTSSEINLTQARISATAPMGVCKRLGADKAYHLRDQVHVISAGGDAYNTGLVASGHCHASIETFTAMHDFLPLIPVIEGAGGVITDWDGQPLAFEPSVRHAVISCNQQIHDQLLALLK